MIRETPLPPGPAPYSRSSQFAHGRTAIIPPVSAENVEIVRRVLQLLNRSGVGEPLPELFDYFAPDIRVDMTRRVFNPDVYEGHEGLRRLGDEVAQVWDEFTLEPERMIEDGDRIIVYERRHGRGTGSGIEVDQRSVSIWTLRDGLVVDLVTDLDPDAL
jgi:ketosteroid isomerase-like protein